MLCPGVARDSSGRLLTTTANGGGAASSVLNGFALGATGRLLFDSGAVAGSVNNGGFARNASNGNVYVATATAGSDIFSQGYRFSITGQLVIAVEGAPARVVNGDPFLADGSLCVTAL